HALDRVDGGRSASHPDARWRVHVPARHQGPRQARSAAPDVRGQPDRLAGRAGWRLRLDRPRTDPRPAARAAASARAGDPGQQERGRAHRALPPRARQRRRSAVRLAAVQRALAIPRTGMGVSTKHPIIAVTGSSGAGTTTVMKSFAHIFRREGIAAQVIEGDSFHRFDRQEMRERVRRADHGEGPQISHFGPESNLLAELDRAFGEYAETGGGQVRRYIHDAAEGRELNGEPGTFTPWQSMQDKTDLLFYEGLHGAYVGPEAHVARHVDLLVGVVPIINLEWIQKL